jgi:hypothetical protein
MTVLIAVLVIGAGLAVWLVLSGGDEPAVIPTPPPSPSPSASQGPAATKTEAARFVSRFAQARMRRRDVDRFVTKELRERYAAHKGGLMLYEYNWDGEPPTDIVGYSIFHVETLEDGNYLVAVNLEVAGSFNASREELIIVGRGTNVTGKTTALVARQAQLPGA